MLRPWAVIMMCHLAYLVILQPLSCPLKMFAELLSAVCECLTTALAYCLMGAGPSGAAAASYGPVMQALMLLSLGMQVGPGPLTVRSYSTRTQSPHPPPPAPVSDQSSTSLWSFYLTSRRSVR